MAADTCRCGHSRDVHDHFREGDDCGPGLCPAYRRPPLHYSGHRDHAQPRASDGDAWLVMAALFPYAVPVETVVRCDPPLPFGMLRRVGKTERLDARRQVRGRRTT